VVRTDTQRGFTIDEMRFYKVQDDFPIRSIQTVTVGGHEAVMANGLAPFGCAGNAQESAGKISPQEIVKFEFL
jgi:hypothetical protein